jgi:probable phosphoglycerate mutase
MELVLIRHGSTEENRRRILQGGLGGRLSAAGRREIAGVAERIRGIRFDTVYSSDLPRARDSAELLASLLALPAPVVDRRLRERGLGRLEGRPVRELLSIKKKAGEDFSTFTAPDGEPAEEFRQRVHEFLREIRCRHARDTVMVVGHFLVNRAVLELAAPALPGAVLDRLAVGHEPVAMTVHLACGLIHTVLSPETAQLLGNSHG